MIVHATSVRPATLVATVRDLIDETGCEPSTGDVAAWLDLHPKAAQRSLAAVAGRGMLVATGNGGGRRWTLPPELTERGRRIAAAIRLARSERSEEDADELVAAIMWLAGGAA